MTGLWILGAILLLICLLCLLRIRVSAEFGAETLLMLWIGPVRLKLYPRKERKEKRQEQKAEHRKKDSHRSIPKPTISDIRDACQALKPALIRALRRTRRGIRIDPLTLSLVLGGREDPAGTAELYGYIHAVVWSVMPWLEKLVKIPNPQIHWDIDFESEKHCLSGSIGVYMRLGTLITVVLTIAIPALRWLYRYTKKQNHAASEQTAQAPAV